MWLQNVASSEAYMMVTQVREERELGRRPRPEVGAKGGPMKGDGASEDGAPIAVPAASSDAEESELSSRVRQSPQTRGFDHDGGVRL